MNSAVGFDGGANPQPIDASETPPDADLTAADRNFAVLNCSESYRDVIVRLATAD
jgi:hypothetical protein